MNILCIIGAIVCWAAAIGMLLVFPLDERMRVEIGGKIDPLKPSWLSLLISAVGIGLIAALAGRDYSGPAAIIALGLFMLLLVKPGASRDGR